MTLIHMAPQVSQPDRVYQGRVQLLEVKYTPAPLFDLQPKAPQGMKSKHGGLIQTKVLSS